MAGIISLLCFTIMAGQFIGIIATDYCNLKSCKQQQAVHTMCKFTSPEPAAACGQHSRPGLSDDERKAIVEKHNELRQKVASGNEKRGAPGPQPPAVSMPNLTWDNELAMVAQRWANQCNFAHDRCRNVDRFVVGQNIAIRASSGKSENSKEANDKMVQSWYDEVSHFDRNQVSRYAFSMHTGHYSQVVWAKTEMIGCGKVEYEKISGGRPWNNYYLVCNYGPAGNWMGEEMYKITH